MAEDTSGKFPAREGVQPGTPPGADGFYARKATGLVRRIGVGNSLVMNLAFVNIALGALTFTVAPYAFPGASLFWVVIITMAFSIAPAMMYALLSGAMPRSGGDYVFVSRILHPIIGFAANFNTTVWTTFFTGILCSWVAGFASSSALLTIGTVLENESLIEWSARVATKGWQFGVGLGTIILFTILVSLGTRVTFRVLGAIFGIMIVGQVAALAVLAANGHSDFVSAFGDYGNYQNVIAGGPAAGFTDSGASAAATFAAIPLVFSSLGFAIVSNYVSGEVKQAGRTQLYSMLGAVALGGVVLAAFGALSERTFGSEFLGSIQALSFTDDYPLNAPPFFYLFVSMLTHNIPLLSLIGIGFVFAIIANIPPQFLIDTRTILAWSFDRIVPMRLSSVNPRTASPVFATVVTGAFMAGFMAFFIYVPAKWTSFVFTAGIGSYLTFFIVAVAGAVFPWRRPDIYAGSPLKSSIVGVPVITIASVFSAAIYALLIYYLLTNDALGANSTQGLVALPVVFGIPLVIYGIAKVVNRRRGVDVALAQQELPPE